MFAFVTAIAFDVADNVTDAESDTDEADAAFAVVVTPMLTGAVRVNTESTDAANVTPTLMPTAATTEVAIAMTTLTD